LTVNTWRIPRESREWVGPIAVTVTANGAPVSDANVEFAVLPLRTHPAEADWAAPVTDPDGSGGIGVQADPVTTFEQLGIWCRVTDTPEAPVLDPSEVGYVIRT
jgi:hypothetical protein